MTDIDKFRYMTKDLLGIMKNRRNNVNIRAHVYQIVGRILGSAMLAENNYEAYIDFFNIMMKDFEGLLEHLSDEDKRRVTF